LDGSLSTRDKTAIRKSFSGLAKILYPHKEIGEEEALELVNFAIEGRKRVKDQLYIIDETFRNEPVEFKYKVISSSKVVEPETLEKLNYATAKSNQNKEEVTVSESGETMVNSTPTLKLESGKNIVIQDNQKGVSYENLFANYLRGAKEIHLTDPYIRRFHQVKNLAEFCQMLYRIKSIDEEITLKVFTSPEVGERQEVDSWLIQLESNLSGTGINLEYSFEASDSQHDRSIETDTGWKIVIGRGLDIFHQFDFRDAFNLANNIQEERLCKPFEVTYLKV
jgi:ATP-dependent Lon protease